MIYRFVADTGSMVRRCDMIARSNVVVLPYYEQQEKSYSKTSNLGGEKYYLSKGHHLQRKLDCALYFEHLSGIPYSHMYIFLRSGGSLSS